MSRENVDVVREMNAAFNAGAYDTFAEFFHPDAEFVDHLPLPDMPASARGREEVRATMDAWREGFSGFQAHVAEYVDLGDFVVAVTRWRFCLRRPRGRHELERSRGVAASPRSSPTH